MKVLGKEYGVMPIVVAAAAVVPISSTSITALCSTWDFSKKDKKFIICKGWNTNICCNGVVKLKTNL